MPEADFLLTKIRDLYQDPRAQKTQVVQTLWSGYGEISRYSLPASGMTCISKHISLKGRTSHHPRGWNTDFSHQRKLSSYQNEQSFYAQLASACGDACRVPRAIASGISDNDIWLVLEDLDAAGYNKRYANANVQITQACVSWLAYFHAAFFNKNITMVWPIGTYWFLATRPDEWTKMQNCELKDAAQLIDSRLNNARYQTLLHGDAKLANFCFSKNTQKVAAVDFQYTGRGCGIKDLIYLLGSCFDSEGLYIHAQDMVDHYFDILIKALSKSFASSELTALEQEWRGLIAFAWADFERFLLGWSPGHQKSNAYSQAQCTVALNLL